VESWVAILEKYSNDTLDRWQNDMRSKSYRSNSFRPMSHGRHYVLLRLALLVGQSLVLKSGGQSLLLFFVEIGENRIKTFLESGNEICSMEDIETAIDLSEKEEGEEEDDDDDDENPSQTIIESNQISQAALANE
jgi:hypothetical protein